MATRYSKGFTLHELMVTLAVAAILMGIAVPSMSSFVTDSRVGGELSDIAVALNLARSEATKRSTTVTVCSRASSTACGAASDWSKGLIVFIDQNGNATLDGTEEVIKGHAVEGGSLAVTQSGFTNAAYLTFSKMGAADSSGQFKVCDGHGGKNGRQIAVSNVGRVSVGSTKVTCP